MADVRIKSKETVKPAEKSWTGTMALTEWDMIVGMGYVPTLYLYKGNEGWGGAAVVDTLKDSLAKLLVHFYPLAGRIHQLPAGRMELRLEEPAIGAELVVAETAMEIADLGDFSDSKRLNRLLPVVEFRCPPHVRPLLMVQVTHFRCGGVSLGFQISHGASDGLSSLYFLKEWSRLARGETIEEVPVLDRKLLRAGEPPRTPPTPDQLSEVAPPLPPNMMIPPPEFADFKGPPPPGMPMPPPDFANFKGPPPDFANFKGPPPPGMPMPPPDFANFKGPPPPGMPMPPPDFANFQGPPPPGMPMPPPDFANFKGPPPPGMPMPPPEFADFKGPPPPEFAGFDGPPPPEFAGFDGPPPPMPPFKDTTMLRLPLTVPQLNKLKELANDVDLAGQRPYSRVEAMTAHIWRCASKTRGHEGDKLNALGVAIDARSRVTPPLPPTYFGNAVLMMTATGPSEELNSNPLGFACSRVRQAIGAATEEYVWSDLDYWKNQRDMRIWKGLRTPEGTFVNPDAMVISWFGLSVYGLDFGWGKEVHMTPGGQDFEGMSMIMPGRKEGEAVIVMCVEVANVEGFKARFYEQLH